MIQENPGTPQPHFRLGVALIGLKRHNEARGHLITAESLGSPAAQAAFRMAQVHAARGAADSAFQQLRRATTAGLSAAPVSTDSDPDMGRAKSDARFAQFLIDMDRNARPCMHDPKHNEFDFWLGTWDVRPNGPPTAPPARNEITKILNGCVVLESWSAPGSTGQSYNIYDRTRGKSIQKWVNNFGGLHEYMGELRDGNMELEGDTPAPRPSNNRIPTRLTFFPRPDGSVRAVFRAYDGQRCDVASQLRSDLHTSEAIGVPERQDQESVNHRGHGGRRGLLVRKTAECVGYLRFQSALSVRPLLAIVRRCLRNGSSLGGREPRRIAPVTGAYSSSRPGLSAAQHEPTAAHVAATHKVDRKNQALAKHFE